MSLENASIELFNCSICSFCETSLDRLVKHIRAHIKPEPCVENSRNRNSAGESSDTQHLKSPTDNDKQSSFYEKHMRYMSSESTSIISQVDENIAGVSDQQFAISPKQKNLLREQKGPMREEKGLLKELAPKNHTPFLPNPSKTSNNSYLFSNPNRREQHFHNHYHPPIYPENTIRTQSNQFHQSPHAQPYPTKPPPRYNMVSAKPPQHQYQRQSEPAGYHEHQPPPPHPPPYEREYGSSHYEMRKQQRNPTDGFHRNYSERTGENSSYHISTMRNNMNQRKNHQVIASDIALGRNNGPMKRPISATHMSDHQSGNRQHPSPLSPSKRQILNNQVLGMQPDLRRIETTIGLPNQNIGLPNQGSVFLNPNHFLQAAGQLPFDKLSGVLLVPLKKTFDVAVQTEKLSDTVSCQVQTELRMSNLLESNINQTNFSSQHIRSLEDVIECPVCANEFHHAERLKEHLSTFHTIICQKCSFSCTNINEYNVHREECDNADEFLCMDCNSAFNSVRRLNFHREEKHNIEMPFRCGICSALFEAHESVMKHISSHDYTISQFKCSYVSCSKIFESVDALNVHTAKHKTMTVMHECRFCNLKFSSNKSLKNHIGEAHVISSKQSNEKPPEVKTPVLSVSNQPETDRKIFLCNHCNLAFRNKFFLKKHIDMCSKNPNILPTSHVCDVCNEFFQTDQLKVDHMKIDHRRENGNRCPKCSKSYRTWFKLKSHTMQQHSKKTCHECLLVFTKDPDLRKHEEEVHGRALTQPGERVYKCSICDATLFTLTDLMNHRKEQHSSVLQLRNTQKNTNTKQEDFPSQKDLENVLDDDKDDEEEHTYLDCENVSCENDCELSVETCPQCNSIFTSKFDLQNHMSSVHGETMSEVSSKNNSEPLKCNRCNKFFDDKRRLKNHLGLIHGQRPFECQICRKKFQYSSQVFWHMKKQHRNILKVKGTIKGVVKNRISTMNNNTSMNSIEYDCDKCGKTFRSRMQLQVHVKHSHMSSLKGVTESNSTENDYSKQSEMTSLSTAANDYRCHICDAAFPQLERYQDHMSSHVGKEINGPSYLNENLPSMVVVNGSTYDEENGDFDDIENDIYGKNEIESSDSYEHDLLKGEPVFDVGLGEYICPICQKTTKSITGMKTHYGRVHRFWSKETTHKDDVVHLKIWQCKSCDREFGQFQNLLDHYQSIHGQMITENEAELHVRYETKTRSNTMKYNYACPHCDVSFDNSKAIRVHTFKKHGVLLNESDLLLWRSDRNDPKGSSVVSRPKIELPDTRYKCQLCMSKFVSTKAIRIHTFKRHGIVLTKKEVMKCKTSAKKPTVTDPFLNRHRGKDLIEEPHPCEECGRVFGNYRALFTHYRQAHRAINATKVPKKPSRTEISANFPTSNTIPCSSSTANKATPLIANESFINTNNIDGKKENEIISASMKVPESNSLVAESPSQEVVPTIQCPKCERIFTQRKSLMTHMYSAHHITKDNYHLYWPDGMPELPRKSSQCPTCGKVCIDERAVRIHIFKAHGVRYQDLINQGEKRAMREENSREVNESPGVTMNCIVCSKQFRRRQALILHELKAHRIKWAGSKRLLTGDTKSFQKCASSTSNENPTNNDYKSMNGQKTIPYVDESKGFDCPICNMFYANRRAITTHLCRIHRFNKDALHSYFEQINHASETGVAIPKGEGSNTDTKAVPDENNGAEVGCSFIEDSNVEKDLRAANEGGEALNDKHSEAGNSECLFEEAHEHQNVSTHSPVVEKDSLELHFEEKMEKSDDGILDYNGEIKENDKDSHSFSVNYEQEHEQDNVGFQETETNDYFYNYSEKEQVARGEDSIEERKNVDVANTDLSNDAFHQQYSLAERDSNMKVETFKDNEKISNEKDLINGSIIHPRSDRFSNQYSDFYEPIKFEEEVRGNDVNQLESKYDQGNTAIEQFAAII